MQLPGRNRRIRRRSACRVIRSDDLQPRFSRIAVYYRRISGTVTDEERAMISLILVRNTSGQEVKVKDSKGAEGYWSKLHMDNLSFDALERAQGYVRLPLGTYQLQMYQSSKLGRVLRPLLDNGKELAGKKNKIRIHSGSIPSHIEGCIAPGYRNPVGNGLPMMGSRVIMNWILLNSGDWKDRKIVGVLFVIEDYSVPDRKHLHLLEPNYSRFSHSVLKGL